VPTGVGWEKGEIRENGVKGWSHLTEKCNRGGEGLIAWWRGGGVVREWCEEVGAT